MDNVSIFLDPIVESEQNTKYNNLLIVETIINWMVVNSQWSMFLSLMSIAVLLAIVMKYPIVAKTTMRTKQVQINGATRTES